MTMQIRNEGVYNSPIAQLDKLARHNRQGSYRSKERYYRVYQGDRPIQELVMAQMEHAHLAHPAFDGDAKDTV